VTCPVQILVDEVLPPGKPPDIRFCLLPEVELRVERNTKIEHHDDYLEHEHQVLRHPDMVFPHGIGQSPAHVDETVLAD